MNAYDIVFGTHRSVEMIHLLLYLYALIAVAGGYWGVRRFLRAYRLMLAVGYRGAALKALGIALTIAVIAGFVLGSAAVWGPAQYWGWVPTDMAANGPARAGPFSFRRRSVPSRRCACASARA